MGGEELQLVSPSVIRELVDSVDTANERITVLERDIKELLRNSGGLATQRDIIDTKSDISNLRQHVDTQINSILSKALDSIPVKWGAIFAGIMALLVLLQLLHAKL